MMETPFRQGDRVTHPDWLGAERTGTIEKVANRWHADVRFDGWTRTVRAALGSLERVQPAELLEFDIVI